MSVYLIDNPPVTRQYRSPRRATPTGCIVVHTAESSPDTIPTDDGAENVARFIQGRSDFGSYHAICDSDTWIQLVRWGDEAFGDATGSNPWAVHVSAATQAHRWDSLPGKWVEGCVASMAEAASVAADWLETEHGIRVPARRITRAGSEAGEPGFISHAERDPARRTDPGAGFPWAMFLTLFDAQQTDTRRTRGKHTDAALAAARVGLREAQQITGGPVKLEARRKAVRGFRTARGALRQVPFLEGGD